MSPSSYFPVLFSNVEHYILSKRIFLFHAQKLWAFVGSRTRVLSYCSPIFFHCASQPRQNVVCFDQYLCAGQSIHRSKYTFSFFEKSFKKFQKRWKIGRENKCLLSSFPNIGRHRNASLAPLKTVIVFTRCFFIEVQEGLIFCPKMVLAGLQVLQ